MTVSHDLDAELPAADAVLMLRVQAERMNGGFFPSAREYSVRYGLSEKRQAMLPGHAVVLHPGPMLRGMEISSSVADSSQSAVLQQVSNGVHVRMAVLFHLLVGAGRGASGCRVMSALLIRGVRLYGEGDRVDVLVDDGQIAEIGAGPARSRTTPTSSTPPVRSCCPASSTCTPTCASPAASTPRTSKPVRPQRLWAVTRRCSRWPTPTRSPTARWSPTTSGTAASRSAWSTCTRSARSPSGLAGNAAHRDGHDGRRRRPGADVLRRRHLRARPAGDAPRPGVRHRPGRADRPARRGAAADRRRRRARGPQRRPAGAGRLAARRRGVDRRPRRAAGPRRRARGCTSATPRPPAPSRSSDGPRSKAFRSPPR